MTWADIAAGRNPVSSRTQILFPGVDILWIPAAAATPSAGRSALAASASPAVPQLPQAGSAQGMRNVNSSFASMSLVTSGSVISYASIVKSKDAPAQATSKKGTNLRNRGSKENHNKPWKGKVAEAKSSTTCVPLKEFHLFSSLPAELRLKIYRFAMTRRRLIELEWGPDMGVDTGLGNRWHHWVRVCPRSRQPPTIMHVSRESREEAEKVYKLRRFDSPVSQYLPNSPEMHKTYIWYNPNADIIFFGEKTCTSTYISIFHSNAEDIPAIAIISIGKNDAWCGHDGETDSVDGGVDTLQHLHGFDPSETRYDYRHGGCHGLKEVFVVVKSRLWRRKQGEINDSVTFRPATNDGLTKIQIAFKSRFEKQISDVEAEIPLPGVGKNLWTGDQKPTFKFVSFAPIAYGADPQEYDGMTVSRENLWELRRGDWAFIKRTEAVTGCEIIVPDDEDPLEDPREIGFHGVRLSIDAAKKAITERLAALGSKNWGN